MGKPRDDRNNPDYRRAIGARIWALRSVMGLTGSEFGLAVGSAHTAVSKWENGKEYPAPVAVRMLCEEFGVDFNYIYGGTFKGMDGEQAVQLAPLIAQKLAEIERTE